MRQTQLLLLSSRSQHLFAETSGHNIHFDPLDAAVGVILAMVGQLRQFALKSLSNHSRHQGAKDRRFIDKNLREPSVL